MVPEGEDTEKTFAWSTESDQLMMFYPQGYSLPLWESQGKL